MRTLAVVVAGPIGNLGAGVIEAEEQGFVEKFVPHPAIEAFTEAVLYRFARRDEVKSILFCSDRTSMALQVNSVPLSQTIVPGLPP
jgi:hypothetical protein